MSEQEHQGPVQVHLNLMMAQEVSEDSWLNQERFARERYALGYAATQTQAISALSKISPEEAYYLFTLMQRGADKYDQSKEQSS